MDIYGIAGSKKPNSNGLQKDFPVKSLKTTTSSGHLIAWATNLNQVVNLLDVCEDHWRVLRNQRDQANTTRLLKENRENLPETQVSRMTYTKTQKSFKNPKELLGSS